ncbi:MAG: hypothetical protein KA383_01510 [Phycisphaerae bacterium]|nr:hypothetical protein [Phycisphaerae bacterium]
MGCEATELRFPSDDLGHGFCLRPATSSQWKVLAEIAVAFPALNVTIEACWFSGFHLVAFAEQLKRCQDTLADAAEVATLDESVVLTITPAPNRAGWFSLALKTRRDLSEDVERDAPAATLLIDGIAFDQSYLAVQRSAILEFLRLNAVDTRDPWSIPDGRSEL